MDQQIPHPSLRDFIRQTKTWPCGNTMLPEEISETQANIDHVRTQVLPQLPVLRRAGFDLVLRGIQRKLDRSIRTIINNFAEFDPSTGASSSGQAHHHTPFYAGYSWKVVSPWVLKNHGQQGLYNFAQNISLEVVRERMRLPTEFNPLPEVYATLASLHGVVPKPRKAPPNPMVDWTTVIAFQRFDLPHAEQVFIELRNLSEDLKIKTNHGSEALLTLSYLLNSGQPAQVDRVLATMDVLLKNDVPFESVIDKMYHPGQEYIKSHAAYRRAKLIEISQSAGLTRASPKRPEM